ncbi:MAG: homocysteine S-methyltransferase [Myxococcales bacterium]|nr:homocysteine S-methyltransferase [Myxococcales bacterium]
MGAGPTPGPTSSPAPATRRPFPSLRARGLDEPDARALLRRSVELVRESCPPQTLVAASVGSYGAFLADGSEYVGGYGLDRTALIDFHRERLRELSAARPDLLAFETIPDLVEIQAIAGLLEDRPGPRAWVSFSLRPGKRPCLADGTPLAEAAAPLRDLPRLAAIGVNCVGPTEVLPALETLAEAAPGQVLLAYPNSGERWVDRDWRGPALDAAGFAAMAATWWSAGARLIGGCCRTRPAHITALAALRDDMRRQS